MADGRRQLQYRSGNAWELALSTEKKRNSTIGQ